MPLSRYPEGLPSLPPQAPASPKANRDEPPPIQVQRMSVREYFQTVEKLLVTNPPHPLDGPLMKQLARVGIVPGKAFDPEPLGVEGRQAFRQSAKLPPAQLPPLAPQAGLA